MPDKLIYVFDPYEDFPWQDALRDMYEDGVRGVSFLCPLLLGWREDGGFDFTLLDELTDTIFSIAPDAELLPRVFLTTPDWWDAAHEDELLKFDGPVPPPCAEFHRSSQKLWKYEEKMYHGTRNPSVASRIWRRDAGRAAAVYTAHLLEHYGRNRIYGIQLAYGTCGEWGQFGSYKNGQFANADFSRPMVAAFRNYLIAKYGNQPSFHTVLPPTKAERMRVEFGILRSPEFYRRPLDYFDCTAKEQLDAIRGFAGAVKQVDPTLPVGCFGIGLMAAGVSAYQLHQVPAAMQGLGLAEISELDFVSTPNGYFDRGRGMYSQAPVFSVSRRKRFIAECDVRTAYAGPPYFPAHSDSLNQFLLEVGYNLATGSGDLWLYDFGHHWYRDKEIREAILAILRLYPLLPDSCPPAEIAVVVDPHSMVCCEGCSGYYRNFLRFLTSELPRCGAPCDFISMDDFFHLPPYKLYIFRDQFLTSPKEADGIRRFLENHRASAIWFGPAGVIQENQIDFEQTRALTGFRLRPVPETIGSNSVTLVPHSLLEGLALPYSLSTVEDLSAVYAPVMTGEGGEILGVVESTGLPGCLFRQVDGRFDLWSNFPVLPAQLLSRLVEKSGIRRRVSGSVALYGAGNLFVIRADQTGEVVVETSGATLKNAISGELYPTVNGEAVLSMIQGQTLLLYRTDSVLYF